jgi:hypothetical protein
MAILPIDLRLRLLVKNMALRLYKIPLNSQLMARVPGLWGNPKPGLPPLPVTPPLRSQARINLWKLSYVRALVRSRKGSGWVGSSLSKPARLSRLNMA